MSLVRVVDSSLLYVDHAGLGANDARVPVLSPSLSTPSSPGERLKTLLAAWTLLFLSGPGILSRDGLGILAFVALVPWALGSSRPGRHAFLIEWLTASLGLGAVGFWLHHVIPAGLLWIGPLPAVYAALAGLLLRRLVHLMPLSLAAPLAWLCLETLRTLIDPPLGFSWMRLGVHLHALPPLAASARVWGIPGLGLVIAGVAGALADQIRNPYTPLRNLAPGAIYLLAALGLGHLVPPPATLPGPRVMIVQPGLEQRRKQTGGHPLDLFLDSCALTVDGIASAQERGEPLPDLIAWGETMLFLPIIDPDLPAAWENGLRPPAWSPRDWTGDQLLAFAALEASWVGSTLFGRTIKDRQLEEALVKRSQRWAAGVMAGTGVIPAGSSFLSGAEYFAERGGEQRRLNSLFIWDAAGQRGPAASKVHLVPGGEQLMGLERLGLIRRLAMEIGGYVPDLYPAQQTDVLTFTGRDGRTWRVGASICFDNAYDDPYSAPLRRGPVDFHLCASNEAWYMDSWEFDQMVAFSRLEALATARSFVRSTNGGVSLVLDPEGRELARLEVGGRDRQVSGTLRVTVPVPEPGKNGLRTPWVSMEPYWVLFWLLAGPLLAPWASRARRKRRNKPGAEG
jgi:apolipoprotein N-acyltransferase